MRRRASREKDRFGWSVLTLETRADLAPELAERVRATFGREPVELSRPQSPRAWVEVYFEKPEAALLAARVCAGWRGVVGQAVREIAQRDWQSFWRRHFHRFDIGERLAIIPAWEPRGSAPRGRVSVRLEPGLSFGTGDHFTTRYCLEAIERLCRQSPPRSLLDVGCGSGILAIAAAKLGVPRVEGFDNDPQAVEQARANARLNDVAPRIRWRVADVLGGLPGRPFEVVCANLYGGLLAEAAGSLCAAAARWLILSGLRETEADAVVGQFVRHGAAEVERDGDGEWCGVRLAIERARAGRGQRQREHKIESGRRAV